MIPDYLFGAGLGRWGLVSNYFGGGGNLWAEIQWTGWLYDGGLGFLIVYPLTVLVMTFQAARLALRHSSRTLGVWAAIVTGYDVGSLALTFSYQVFTSAGGVQFWLINALLLQASQTSDAEESDS